MSMELSLRINLLTNEVEGPQIRLVHKQKLLFLEKEVVFNNVGVVKILENKYGSVKRIIFRSLPNHLLNLNIILDLGSPIIDFIKKNSLVIARSDRFVVIKNICGRCYNENIVGPYKISCIENIFSAEDNYVKLVVKGSFDKTCEESVLVAGSTKELSVEASEDLFQRLWGGYFEDGLIWALVRSGRVPRNELPSFIEDEQAYYWPRGDLLHKSLHRWYLFEDELSLQQYLEIIQQIIDQISDSGGLLIPYITAARRSNIYGSPQQLYLFETLYRSYQLLGLNDLRIKALNALRCYLEQPPKCLGHYNISGRGIWFRWGSYHYLSRDPEGKEDLYVLNTHLMGLVGLSEAWFIEKCDWCREYALEGLKGLKNLIKDFQRSDGYLYYSLFNKELFGEAEDKIMPFTLGYHTLSARYILRISYLLGEEKLVNYGEKACKYSLEKFFSGRRDIRDELIRCLVELYRAGGDEETIDLIDKVIREAPDPPFTLIGYGLGDVVGVFIPPKIRSVNNSSIIILLNNTLSEAEYLIYPISSDIVILENKYLPSGKYIEVEDVLISDKWLRDAQHDMMVKKISKERYEIESSKSAPLVLKLLIRNN